MDEPNGSQLWVAAGESAVGVLLSRRRLPLRYRARSCLSWRSNTQVDHCVTTVVRSPRVMEIRVSSVPQAMSPAGNTCTLRRSMVNA